MFKKSQNLSAFQHYFHFGASCNSQRLILSGQVGGKPTVWLNLSTLFSPHQQSYVFVYQPLHHSTVCVYVGGMQTSSCPDVIDCRPPTVWETTDNHEWERYHAHTYLQTQWHRLTVDKTENGWF